MYFHERRTRSEGSPSRDNSGLSRVILTSTWSTDSSYILVEGNAATSLHHRDVVVQSKPVVLKKKSSDYLEVPCYS